MAEYNTCTCSSSPLTDAIVTGKKKHKSYYYVCLGYLVHMVDMQIQNRYGQNEELYLIGSRYTKILNKWVQQFKHKEFIDKDFFKASITSLALFAVGIKLASELGALKLY